MVSEQIPIQLPGIFFVKAEGPPLPSPQVFLYGKYDFACENGMVPIIIVSTRLGE
jgi:hypothetical protein